MSEHKFTCPKCGKIGLIFVSMTKIYSYFKCVECGKDVEMRHSVEPTKE